MRKPQGTWTKVKRGLWTWNGYHVIVHWTYEGRTRLMPYWAWFVIHNNEYLPGWHAAARQAKNAAEEHYSRYRVR